MRVLKACLGVILLSGLATAGGFLWFIADIKRPSPPPPRADGIVVLTGGAERVETGLRLLAGGQARLLLVSGVAHGADLAELAHLAGLNPAPLAGRVTIGHLAVSTRGNAAETRAWADSHAIRSLIVVTAFYHMPRALAELRPMLPDVELHPVAVHSRLAQGLAPGSELTNWRVLADEYVKYLAVSLGLGHLMPARETELPATPPDHPRTLA
jgi:uncharacterized SAM-binding protein YcdF (DUF218 family)